MSFASGILKILGGDQTPADPETPVALIAVRDFMRLWWSRPSGRGIVATSVDERSALWTARAAESLDHLVPAAGATNRPENRQRGRGVRRRAVK